MTFQRIDPSQTDAKVRDSDCEVRDEFLDGVQEGQRSKAFQEGTF